MAREWLNMIWGNASGAYYESWRKATNFVGPIPRGWMWYGIPKNLRQSPAPRSPACCGVAKSEVNTTGRS